MSESTQVEGQEPKTTPQVDPANPNGQAPKEQDAQTYTKEYVGDLRKEAATYRTKANDLQKQLETALTELNGLKAEQTATKTREAFAKAAAEAGAVYSDPLFSLVSDKLTVGEDGTPDPESMKTAIEETKKSFPALFKTPNGKQIDASSKGDTPTFDFNAWVRRSAGISPA